MKRHIRQDERPIVFEQLVEMSRRSPRRKVAMLNGGLQFTQLGEFKLSKQTPDYILADLVFDQTPSRVHLNLTKINP